MLIVRDLSVNYGSISALKDVSFQVQEGEIVTLVGANGAGKTTALQTLSGLVPVASGSIEFLGESLNVLPTHKRVIRGLSQSPEGRMVFSDFTVKENLWMGAFSRALSRATFRRELEHIFEIFPRLKERQYHNAELLSGGEQQMLAIARALMAKPKMLLLDEPSLGVSPLMTQAIFRKIVELNREEGMTILLAEQNAHMALEIAHRCYVLEVGRVTKEGPAAQLLLDADVQRAYLGG